MDYKAFKRDCIGILRQSIGEDYVGFVFNEIGGDLIEGIESACGSQYNGDDIKMAIGRVLCNRFGVEF